MTSTAVVLGMAPLGKPWPLSSCDCATDSTESAATSKEIVYFIRFSSRLKFAINLIIRVRKYSLRSKKLRFSETLYDEFSRFPQDLLTPLSVRTNSRHHQHTCHAGK